MGHSLSSQLQYAVLHSRSFGSDKYSDRKNGESQHKTYSHKATKDRLDTAKSLGKYIKEHFPEVKMARNITAEHINAWLDHKANTGCRMASLETYAANARSVMRLCSQAFPTCKDLSGIKTPEEKPDLIQSSGRDPEGMKKDDYAKIRQSVNNANLARGMDIARMTGARADGCTHITGNDIHIYKDGSMRVYLQEKGGRGRKVDVINEKYKNTLKEYKQIYGNNRIVPIKPESLERSLARAMRGKELGKDYKGTKMHSIRKLWANERYKEYRQTHNKLETVQYINLQLGHSADRDEALLAHYVDSIY